jgi:hypothetical protein
MASEVSSGELAANSQFRRQKPLRHTPLRRLSSLPSSVRPAALRTGLGGGWVGWVGWAAGW